MKRLATAVAAIALVAIAAPADARPYSQNGRVGAHLLDVRKCQGALTVYEVDLRNEMPKARRFRAFEVERGVKLSDRRHRVSSHSETGLLFYIPAGERRAVTVVYAGEVVVHRHLRGICY